jgi:hypothetical protein
LKQTKIVAVAIASDSSASGTATSPPMIASAMPLR